jgi:DNA anti-recombination protein RmuC
MQTQIRKLLAVACMLAAASMAVADQVYRWVDKNGVVHYTQTPPPGTNAAAAKTVDISAPPPDSFGAKSDQALINTQAAQNKSAQDAAQKAQADAQQKAALQKACEAEKAQLQQMQDARRITMTDSKGETQYVTGDDRLKAMDDLQKRIDKDCGSH